MFHVQVYLVYSLPYRDTVGICTQFLVIVQGACSTSLSKRIRVGDGVRQQGSALMFTMVYKRPKNDLWLLCSSPATCFAVEQQIWPNSKGSARITVAGMQDFTWEVKV